MNKNQSFHSKLIIVDHFDETTNEIDINTEEKLIYFNQKQQNDSDSCNILNEILNEQLNEITKVKENNLSQVKYKDDDDFKSKYDSTLTFEKNVDKIKEELISTDCVLMEDLNFKSNVSLWLTPFYLNQEHLKFRIPFQEYLTLNRPYPL